ncbi:unnamed protein product [Prunus armeniaca]|uniref:Uncharacterized protein n=1 Tax=Prunus armeniaca TaxID=36596 RepID=A0A6J5V346_PRUAR|nr:unnamed protein product [Prunus armeniaca]CAB4312665.1 unnamed protein product [Prunus armeniaca]
MGFGGSRLCLCLLLAFALISSARNNIPFSDDEVVAPMEGRSLMVRTDDYSDPTANRGHDPSSSSSSSFSRAKAGGRGGRKG